MDITYAHMLLLFIAAIWAGALNAIAGGGTFFTFPVLLLVGIPPIIANTTNKFALSFASIAGVAGFWQEIRAIRANLLFFCSLGLIGSIAGSIALLLTPASRFEAMIPWLMLSATILFALGNRLVRWLSRKNMQNSLPTLDEHRRCEPAISAWYCETQQRKAENNANHASQSPAIGFFQCLIGIYGGFFAAGMGILMMALYELSGMKNIHEMNALKTAVGLGINVVSALTFMLVGTIHWPIAVILMMGALIGGYSGATLSKRLAPAIIRGFIICYGCGMTLYFFIR